MDTPLLLPPHRTAWFVPVSVSVVVLLVVGAVIWWLRPAAPSATNNANSQSRPAMTRTGWQIFTNTKYHYRFAYPGNWTAKVISDEQVELFRNGITYSIEGAETYAIGIFVEQNTAHKSLSTFAADHQKSIESSVPGAKVTIANLKVNTLPAIQTTDYLAKNVMVLTGDQLVTITTPEFGDAKTDAPVRDVFDLLLPTFSYTP